MAYCKKIIVIFAIFLLLFSTISFATDWQDWKFEDDVGINYRYTDNYNMLFETYDSIVQNWLIRLLKAKKDGSNVPDSIFNYLNSGYWVYVYKGESSTYGENMVNVLDSRPRYQGFILYRNMTSYTNREPSDNSGHDAYNGHSIITDFVDLKSSYAFYGQCDYNNITLSSNSGSTTVDFVIPKYLIQYNSQVLTTFLIDYNNNKSTDELLNSIYSKVNDIESNTEMTATLQGEANQELADINEELNTQTTIASDTNQFLKNESVQDSSTNIEIENTLQEPYNNQVDNVFNKIYNKFTSFNGLDFGSITFNIPFCNESITITSDQITAFHNKCGYLVTLFNLFWFYVLGKMIILDLLKIIDNLSSGDFLTNKTDTTIKADML